MDDAGRNNQPIGGFARQWYTNPVVGRLSLGGGYFVGITARDDIALGAVADRVGALPESVGHDDADSAYPRLNNGDVAFFRGRYEF
ncbi:hypothetical protein AWB81_03112 [Caballeronia arationis]|uniref:hypothetical protein n=1 Tax=Caballeronia arationis TaxID=1777142 RepID=UPI00074B49B5|nr:hypothetical protein [Caballeronia arationis]SAK70520.1 hypothetical protein AWB81_03112 [Caballeronia arationis]